jgi:hypothetical protein
MIPFRPILIALTAVLCTLVVPVFAQNSPAGNTPQAHTTTQPKPATLDLREALSVSDLKIEMAESSWKIKQTLQTLVELANALEKYLNDNCFGDMLKTLSYVGPPTNPDCIARMERLLDIYPEDPVAICLRDGIAAQSCSDAYRGQSMKQFSPSTSLEESPDAALRVGLSAADVDKLRAISETLGNVNKDYQRASSDEEKQKHTDDAMHLYDKALSISCKIVAIQLEDPTSGKRQNAEDSSVRDIREKLLKVPPSLRADYQNRLMTEAEEELARAKDDPLKRQLVKQKIEAILNPEIDARPKASGKIRYRVVLPECYELIGKASVLVPNLPSTSCHRDGWQSPQCMAAMKKWNDYRAQVAERKRRSEKRAQPTPGSQISSF